MYEVQTVAIYSLMYTVQYTLMEHSLCINFSAQSPHSAMDPVKQSKEWTRARTYCWRLAVYESRIHLRRMQTQIRTQEADTRAASA
jgi:hypothetical protein